MDDQSQDPRQTPIEPVPDTESEIAADTGSDSPAPEVSETAATPPPAPPAEEAPPPPVDAPPAEPVEAEAAPVAPVAAAETSEAAAPPPPAEVEAEAEVPAAAVETTELDPALPPEEQILITPEGEPEYPRFRLMARLEHMTLLVSFTILCLTGLPQKFPFSPISLWMIDVMGGIEVVRMIHRWAAIVLILGSVYHLLTSAYRLFVKHEDMRMLPDLKDGFDLRDTVAYNLGFIDEPPKMRKFNFGEKFEYWAVVWGTAVMIVTGFILWNPIAATRFLPGSLIPVALEAHGWEAVLAALSIIIWHLYNVLVKHRNKSMFTGTLSHKIMEEEHALELERLEAGGDPWKVVPPDVLARRRKIYFAVASVVVVLAFALVIWMFTFEDTAIIVPQATRDVFVPLATPIP